MVLILLCFAFGLPAPMCILIGVPSLRKEDCLRKKMIQREKNVHKSGSYLYTDQYGSGYIADGHGKGKLDTSTNHFRFQLVREKH